MAAFTKEEVCRIWLSSADLPVAKTNAIIGTYGSALAFFQAFGSKMWDIIPARAYETLKALHSQDAIVAMLDKLHQAGISVLISGSEAMPVGFESLADAPAILYVKGDTALLKSQRILSIVGTRKPTDYGRMMAVAIAQSLATADVVIANGFARGIDTAALDGAVKAGGKTIAFMGTGLDVIYPPENHRLLDMVIDNGGLLVSEYAAGAGALPSHFPPRNRLISAIGHGLLFIEGEFKGGGMISVNHALEQGKDVFVLPGQANLPLYEAPHALIRDGARLITSGADILSDMGWEAVAKEPERQAQVPLDDEQAAILSILDTGEHAFDEIAQKTNQNAASLNSNLTIMELAGIIKKSPGRIFMKVKR